MSDDKPSQKRIIEPMMVELMNTFSELPAFSYVFLTADGTCATGPSLASIVDLACCAVEKWNYEGPHPKSHFKSQFAAAVKRQQEIVEIVTQRMSMLHNAGVSFIICWHVYGERQPHLDWFGDYNEEKMQNDLFRLLANEVDDYPVL